jgi:hypothetical protein
VIKWQPLRYILQAACDAEKERRVAAERAADEMRNELEKAAESSSVQLQSLSAAAERRVASAAADVALLERALEASAAAQREADRESRELVASSTDRARAASDRVVALEAQVRLSVPCTRICMLRVTDSYL